jgi:pyruvate/2-oxoglutarate dehydrogenase complex dihydrolipoamide acyltransferase (E2) component
VFNSVLGISEDHPRTNPAEIQGVEEAAAAKQAAAAAEQAAAETTAAEVEKSREAADLAFEIKREAAGLGFDMDAASSDLDDVLDEDGKVYGEDGTARLSAIAKKYESYTTEALDDLRDELPSKVYQTDRVRKLNSRWIEWWDDFVAEHRSRWIAADNGDTVSLTRINERMAALWDEWSEMFDRLAELQEISASDL